MEEEAEVVVAIAAGLVAVEAAEVVAALAAAGEAEVAVAVGEAEDDNSQYSIKEKRLSEN